MNILFFTDSDLSPYTGGIERVTINLVKELKKLGHSCYLGFFKSCQVQPCEDFTRKFMLNPQTHTQQLEDILHDYNISTCINNVSSKQYLQFFSESLYRITRKIGNIKVIFGFYNIPGYELFGVPLSLGLYRLSHGQFNSNTINGMLATICKRIHCDWWIKKRISKKLAWGLYADEIVLLSERYIPLYKQFIGEQLTPSISAIGNPLSYESNINKNLIPNKKKTVIQIARFDDNFKRQTTALKIWKIIEDSGRFDEWKFLMIGYGQDEKYIKDTAKSLKLQHVEFQGMQDPQINLTHASIYMMTSAFEGLPMILLDAQQFGVVPIAFDCFESIYDIITNKHNGIIIPANQHGQYAESLMWLMDNPTSRKTMALNGLDSCQRYRKDKIVQQWINVMQ